MDKKYSYSRTFSKDIRHYGKHPVYTDGALWYQEACKSLGLEHRLLYEDYKSFIERAIQYFKDRTESFDDCYPCRKRECSLEHIQKWLRAFILHKQPEYLKLIELIKEVMA
ncbi:MAG: hypothetical protein QXX95_04125 [Nitrososphaerales archaeon]